MAPVKFEDIQVGKGFSPETVVLTREVIESYKDTVCDHNPLYDDQSPFGHPVAPPTLGAIYLFRSFHSTFPPAPGRLHASLEFDFFHPWREGAIITITGHVVDAYIKRGKKYALFELTFTDEQGTQVARASVEEVTPE